MFFLRGLVFRKGETPEHFLDIMLDNGTLRRLKVIQGFHPQGSTLYFRDTALLEYNSGGADDVSQGRQYLMRATISTPRRAKGVTVHLDSGAIAIYLSRDCLKRLRCAQMPKHLYMNVGANVWVWHSRHVKMAGSDDYDVVMGTKFFSRYCCMFDYDKKMLYLKVGKDYWSYNLMYGNE